jgi:hypothetical protein
MVKMQIGLVAAVSVVLTVGSSLDGERAACGKSSLRARFGKRRKPMVSMRHHNNVVADFEPLVKLLLPRKTLTVARVLS